MAANPLPLRAYLAATRAVPLVAHRLLKRRLSKGKEHPDRWREKLGVPSAPRPDGPLIWINAVGLGEVLSLRGLIANLTEQAPDITVLVTSTTRHSAEVFAANLPPRTIHQLLPLDAPPYRRAFLDHWTPDVAIWAEQDLWPGFVVDLAKRGIPQAIIAARMNAQALASRQKSTPLFRALYGRMAFVTAQDDATAQHLGSLGAKGVRVTGSMKPAAPPLMADPADLSALQDQLSGRFVWTVASSYPEDEALAISAQALLRKTRPDALLILAPRQIDRTFDLPQGTPRRSMGQVPSADDPVWLADTIGEMGLWLRLSKAALIGGTFNDTQGHNPWESINLGVPVIHGPETNNFLNDFQSLDALGVGLPAGNPEEVAAALLRPDLGELGVKASEATATARAHVKDLATDILSLAKVAHD